MAESNHPPIQVTESIVSLEFSYTLCLFKKNTRENRCFTVTLGFVPDVNVFSEYRRTVLIYPK
jgi:hypothetical protein